MSIFRHPIYNFANLLTVCNLLLGAFSILCALNGKLDFACYALLSAMACDFLDGFLARLLRVNGDFGKQLDSLADMISFGLAPGILMFVMIILGIDIDSWKNIAISQQNCQMDAGQFVQIKIQEWSDAFFYQPKDGFEMYNPCEVGTYYNPYDASIKYLPFTAFIIPLFSILRLAKFNIDENQKNFFIGIPTPMSTFFFIFFPMFFVSNFEILANQSSVVYALFDCYSLVAIVTLFSPLMVAPITLIAMKFQSPRFNENAYRITFFILSLISIPIFQWWSIPFILTLYLGLSILQQFLTRKNEI
ncbi:MAG: CDP-alcohol phosphatidyltransferase family protein [Bacteroidetes bacterium]|nr:CDP-alcohol phosphatidyltransferase family protein [Bacteroidota bacterium]